MHGVTRQVSIPFHFLRPPVRGTDSRSMILNVAGGLRLARKDFGIVGGATYNSWFTQARSATMADSVDINLEVEGWLSDAESQRSPGVLGAVDRIQKLGVDSQVARFRATKATKTAA